MNGFIKNILLILLLAFSQPVFSQTTLVKASADKNKILLGEPFWLTLEIRAPGGSNIEPFKIDSIPHFEFLKKDSIQKTSEGGAVVIRQYFQLTSFDSGRWVIPPFELRPFVKTGSLLVDVVFTNPFDPTQPYHDIQDVKNVPVNKNRLLLWIALALALLLALAIIIYFATQKRLKLPPAPPKIPPYEKAKNRLHDLKTAKSSEKIFYEKLVSIFRAYVLERTGIDSLQQTSNDLVAKLKPLFDEEKDAISYDSLSQVLYLSDFVKFAKYSPAESEAQSAFEVIDRSIDHIEQKMKLNNLKQ